MGIPRRPRPPPPRIHLPRRRPGPHRAFEPEDPALAARQQAFIADFAKDPAALHYAYTSRATLLDHLRRMELPLNVSAGRPCNLPEPIGSLFIGRADFMAALRATLAAGETTVIRGKQAVHGMGGVGKTRAAIEYGWENAARYNAILFVTADSLSRACSSINGRATSAWPSCSKCAARAARCARVSSWSEPFSRRDCSKPRRRISA